MLQYEAEECHQVVDAKLWSIQIGEDFFMESSVMWIFSSGVPTVLLPDDVLLKVRYEYTSPPDMLKKQEQEKLGHGKQWK